MSVVDEVLKANEQFASHRKIHQLPMPPRRHLAIVTCMDARIIPTKMLGLAEGDAHIIRNAGGRAKEALRSLVISQRLLGTNEVAVIHHTDCGMLTFTNDSLRKKVREELGADSGDLDFLPFTDVKQSVADDIAFLRASPLIPKSIPIRGLVYDVATGRLTEVGG
ncbi:MAG: beta-class carbonic anhydrase [Gemmatimonadales bacterium]